MNNIYLDQAKQKIKNPKILVNVAAKRATELAQRYRPLVEVPPQDDHSYINIALMEIAAGMLSVDTDSAE